MPTTSSRHARPLLARAVALAMFAFLTGVVGLALPGARAAFAEAPARRQGPESGLVGVWQGTTIAICPGSIVSRCNAHQKVTMTLVQGAGSKLGGYYKCAYGNANCYNMNETGKIGSATLNGGRLWLRVIMHDGTSCLFNGRVTNNSIDGGYSCSSGGSTFERGSWRAKREY
jgi:hypothetical protein